jgi:hypothetical protein
MSAGAGRWIRRTITGCVALLALIAGLVEPHGQPGWVAALTPLSVAVPREPVVLRAVPRPSELPLI